MQKYSENTAENSCLAAKLVSHNLAANKSRLGSRFVIAGKWLSDVPAR